MRARVAARRSHGARVRIRRDDRGQPALDVVVHVLGRRLPGQEFTDHFERSEEHTSELQSRRDLVCRLLLEKKKKQPFPYHSKKKLHTTNSHSSGNVVMPDIAFLAGACDTGISVWIGSIFFFNDPATTEIYTLSLHDALPI